MSISHCLRSSAETSVMPGGSDCWIWHGEVISMEGRGRRRSWGVFGDGSLALGGRLLLL